jgi:uncharacterized protein YcgI (DUF1989 family)
MRLYLYSDEARGTMTIIADTRGVHDILAGACSRFTNEKTLRREPFKDCRDNLRRSRRRSFTRRAKFSCAYGTLRSPRQAGDLQI